MGAHRAPIGRQGRLSEQELSSNRTCAFTALTDVPSRRSTHWLSLRSTHWLSRRRSGWRLLFGSGITREVENRPDRVGSVFVNASRTEPRASLTQARSATHPGAVWSGRARRTRKRDQRLVRERVLTSVPVTSKTIANCVQMTLATGQFRSKPPRRSRFPAFQPHPLPSHGQGTWLWAGRRAEPKLDASRKITRPPCRVILLARVLPDQNSTPLPVRRRRGSAVRRQSESTS